MGKMCHFSKLSTFFNSSTVGELDLLYLCLTIFDFRLMEILMSLYQYFSDFWERLVVLFWSQELISYRSSCYRLNLRVIAPTYVFNQGLGFYNLYTIYYICMPLHRCAMRMSVTISNFITTQ